LVPVDVDVEVAEVDELDEVVVVLAAGVLAFPFGG
jgi:hypothetical protein